MFLSRFTPILEIRCTWVSVGWSFRFGSMRSNRVGFCGNKRRSFLSQILTTAYWISQLLGYNIIPLCVCAVRTFAYITMRPPPHIVDIVNIHCWHIFIYLFQFSGSLEFVFFLLLFCTKEMDFYHLGYFVCRCFWLLLCWIIIWRTNGCRIFVFHL